MCIIHIVNKIVHIAYCLSFLGLGVCSILFEILIVRDDLSRVHFNLSKLCYNVYFLFGNCWSYSSTSVHQSLYRNKDVFGNETVLRNFILQCHFLNY